MVIFIIRNTVRSALRALMPTVLAVCYGDDGFLMIFYYAFSPNISISSVPFVRCHQSSGRSVWRVSEDTSPEWNSQNCKHKFQLLRSFAKALPGSDLGTGNIRRSWTIRAVKMTWSFRAFRLIFIRIPSEYWWSRRIHRGWQAVLIDNKLVILNGQVWLVC